MQICDSQMKANSLEEDSERHGRTSGRARRALSSPHHALGIPSRPPAHCNRFCLALTWIHHSVLQLLYQDDLLIAVSKPSGLVVHRSSATSDRDTCMTLLRNKLRRWVYPVHRLDRGASGVLLFALDSDTARSITETFMRRSVKKSYLAVVRGILPETGSLDYPLVEEPGKEPAQAQTSYARLAEVELPHAVGRYPTVRYSLARVEPLTGRMHQIRRHMAHLRHPLIGDVTYGEGRHNRLFRDLFGSSRLLLHAEELRLPHPRTGAELCIKAPLPDELTALFRALGWSAIPD